MHKSSRILLSGLALLAPAFGYIRLSYVDSGTIIALRRNDTKSIQYYINDKVVKGATSTAIGASSKVVTDSSDPVTAIREAFDTWNRVTGTEARFAALKSTTSLHDISDGKNVVMIGANLDDLTALGFSPGRSIGAIAITANVWYQQDGTTADGTAVAKGVIADSDIIMNPVGNVGGLVFSTDGTTAYDVQTVLTHEIGHALGQNHTGLMGSTMFQFSAVGTSAVLTERLISTDEQAFVRAVYPSGAQTGTLSGRVLFSGAAAKFALVTLIDTSSGVTTGTITDASGNYSQIVAPGSYIVSAEPFNSIVTAANITGLDTSGATTGFQHTFAGGATPSSNAVTAGGTRTVDFTVDAATSTLALPFINFGAAGGTRDITTLNGIGAPIILQGGRALDVAFLGAGLDASTVVQVYGQGATVRAGSTRIDTGVNFSQGPLVRTTLDLASRETPTLITMVVSKGGAKFALAGFFLLVPPKPVFTSRSIVNAASYVGLNGDGVVTAGGLYSIYAATGSALGPAAFAQNGPYDAYGKLANTLGGVGVTFDGVPAPMFLSFSGQLNLQVPFEVAGKTSTQVQVTFNGSASDKITVPVAASQPAFFTVTPAGNDSIIGNQNFTLNTAANAEARGGVVSIYGTGFGKLSYDVPTGVGAGGPPAGYTGNNTCVVGGKTVAVAFTGWTPSAVGLGQWSFVIPADVPIGRVTVKCTDPSGASTQDGTLYVK